MSALTKLIIAFLILIGLSAVAATTFAKGLSSSQKISFWNDHGNNGGNSGNNGGSSGTKSAVPEIDPAGMTAMLSLVGGGLALMTAKRRNAVR